MNNVTAFAQPQNARELALIRRTVAADTTDDEFNLFIHTARHLGLDPLRRQVYAFVYGKKAKDQSKRRMSIITGIDGFRAIAERTGNYRPDDDEPTYQIDNSLIGPSNPAGLVKATVRVYKHSHGDWHKVTASAFWAEYAPLKEVWSDTKRIQDGEWPDGNPRYKDAPVEGATKVLTLDDSGNWAKMPRLMLAKVAEALALRKAWPDNFSGLYSPEELDRAQADMTAAELAAAGAVTERLERIGGGGSIVVDWLNGAPIEPVAAGKFADRVLEFLEQNRDAPSQIGLFETRNRHALREFWAQSPGDALELKKKIEQFQAESIASE